MRKDWIVLETGFAAFWVHSDKEVFQSETRDDGRHLSFQIDFTLNISAAFISIGKLNERFRDYNI